MLEGKKYNQKEVDEKKGRGVVKKPEELIGVRTTFSEGALKLSAYLLTILREDQDVYRISMREYMRLLGKKGNNFQYIYSVAKELADKTFSMKDRRTSRFSIYNFIDSIDYKHGVMEIEFGHKLKRYLLAIRDRYLKYGFENILPMKGRYPVLMFEILKNQFEKEKRYHEEDGEFKAEIVFDISELREKMRVPDDYASKDFRRIVEKSVKEINKCTDILVEYEFIKKSQRYSKVKFLVKDKDPASTMAFRGNLMKILSVIPESHREECLNVIMGALKTREFDYVMKQVEFTVSKGDSVRDFGAFLSQAIAKDYAGVETSLSLFTDDDREEENEWSELIGVKVLLNNGAGGEWEIKHIKREGKEEDDWYSIHLVNTETGKEKIKFSDGKKLGNLLEDVRRGREKERERERR